jgi:hypothetical protein
MSLSTFTAQILALVESIEGEVGKHVNVDVLDSTVAAALAAGDGFAGVLGAVLANAAKIFPAGPATDHVAKVLAATHAAAVNPDAIVPGLVDTGRNPYLADHVDQVPTSVTKPVDDGAQILGFVDVVTTDIDARGFTRTRAGSMPGFLPVVDSKTIEEGASSPLPRKDGS